jgi:hypothetical protein
LLLPVFESGGCICPEAFLLYPSLSALDGLQYVLMAGPEGGPPDGERPANGLPDSGARPSQKTLWIGDLYGTPQLKWVHAGIAMTKCQLKCFLPALARSDADRVEFVIDFATAGKIVTKMRSRLNSLFELGGSGCCRRAVLRASLTITDG